MLDPLASIETVYFCTLAHGSLSVLELFFALHFLSAADSTGSPLPAQLSLTAIYPSAGDVM